MKTGEPVDRPASGRRLFRPRLRLFIVIAFLPITALLAVALGLLASQSTQNLVDRTVTRAFNGSADLAILDLERLEETAMAAAEALASHPISRTTSLEEREAQLLSMATILRTVPEVSAVYVGWPDGNFLLLRPLDNRAAVFEAPAGTAWIAQWSGDDTRFDYMDAELSIIETDRDVDYDLDPRTRPWFTEAGQADGAIVTSPYVFFTTREPGISAARQSTSGAVAGVDVSLWDLARRLPREHPAPQTQAAILDGVGKVLAYNQTDRLRTILDGAQSDSTPSQRELSTGDLPAAVSIGSPVVTNLAEHWVDNGSGFSGRIEVDDRIWQAAILPLDVRDTALVMAAPLDGIAPDAQSIRLWFLKIFALTAALFIPLVWFAAGFVSRPFETSTADIKRVSRRDFTVPSGQSSRIKEIAALEDATQIMQSSLRGYTAACKAIAEEDRCSRLLGRSADALMDCAGAIGSAVWRRSDDGGHWRLTRIQPVTARSVFSPDGDGETVAAKIVTADSLTTFSLPAGAPATRYLGFPIHDAHGAPSAVLAIACRIGPSNQGLPGHIEALADFLSRALARAMDRRQLISDKAAALRETETILNSVADGIYVLDSQGRILSQNPAATEILGWTLSDVAGLRFHDLIDCEGLPRAPGGGDSAIELTLADGRIRAVQDVPFKHADGRTLPGEFQCAAKRDGSTNIVGAVVSFRDIQERRDLDEKLRQSQKMEVVGQLTGGIAHDFNNLLTVIVGNVEYLQRALRDQPDLLAAADITMTAAQRGADLTSRLLAFARRQPLKPQSTDINRLIDGMEGLLRRTLPANVDIVIRPTEDLWRAEIDPGQLEVGILNIALNACDAMPDGGNLTIETANYTHDSPAEPGEDEWPVGDYVMMAIRDTGCGIPSSVLPQVFEPFFTTKDVGKGTGLGLSMVWGFVKQSRGHVEITSERGKGTTVRVFLPRQGTPVEATTSQSADRAANGE